MADSTAMDMDRVMELLPHRYPFLLVDRVLECQPGESLRALKNVTVNEPFFQGHFPGRPVMPGVLILEALAQACGILAFSTAGEMPGEDTGVYFVGIDKSRFRRPAFPGDQLILEIEFERRIRDIWRFTTRALVEGKVVADARMMVATKGNDR
ncbi:MAG: 3-hydroxyacyl-ACP dehydratase FabZ [Gammaproteobacteria bacterium]|jgi:3-hydroxyacyl-[acyl-carrier-protein] dehydratase|nr:MAG: hypothetical protein AMJ59_12225 [Gammaproteobacteria bacterium SG8_31]